MLRGDLQLLVYNQWSDRYRSDIFFYDLADRHGTVERVVPRRLDMVLPEGVTLRARSR